MTDLTKRAEQAEGALLIFFPLIFGLFILPRTEPSEAFVTPRLGLLTCFLALILVLRLARLFDTRRLPHRRDIPSYIYASIAFAAVGVISSLSSHQPTLSLFGEPKIQTGSLFVVLMLGLLITYATAPRRVTMLGVYLLAVVLSILAILEFIGFRPLYFMLNDTIHEQSAFPIVTIGYRGQLAGLFAFLAGLVLIGLHQQRNNLVLWAVFILTVTALSTSSTSSAWLAFVLGMVLYAWLNRNDWRHSAAVLVAGTALLFASVPLHRLNIVLVDNSVVTGQAQGESIFNGTTGGTRLLLWKAGLRMFQERPWFGWGNQNYENQWYRYLSPEDGDNLVRAELSIPSTTLMARVNDSVVWVTDDQKQQARLKYFAPHNFLVEVAYANGILGLVTLAWLLVSLGIALVRQHSAYALIPLVVYGAYLFGWFLTVPTTAIVFMALGMLLAQQQRTADSVQSRQALQTASAAPQNLLA